MTVFKSKAKREREVFNHDAMNPNAAGLARIRRELAQHPTLAEPYSIARVLPPFDAALVADLPVVSDRHPPTLNSARTLS